MNPQQLVILGTRAHEGQMLGRTLEHLQVEPTYVDPRDATLPSDPPPDVVLLSREWSIELRHAAAQARRAGIPVIYLMDGVIEWSYMWDNWNFIKPEGTVLQPLIASDLCVIGHHPARILAGLGLADRIHVVGMPRLDAAERQRILDQDAIPEILIASASTFGHNTAHQVFVRAALRDLKNWFDQHAEIKPVWRIEPRLAEEIGVGAQTGKPIMDDLRHATGVVSFTSTVLLEAMLVGVPTAQIDYRPVPQYVQTAWEIRNSEHIEEVIRELLYPSPEKLAYQESCLRDELEFGDASKRLAEVIRNAASRACQGATQKGPDAHGQLDFRQVHSHLSAFSIAPMSRVQYELDAAYKLWERDRERLVNNARELTELRNQLGALGEIRGVINQLSHDILLKIIQRLGWLPGVRRTARLIGELTAWKK